MGIPLYPIRLDSPRISHNRLTLQRVPFWLQLASLNPESVGRLLISPQRRIFVSDRGSAPSRGWALWP